MEKQLVQLELAAFLIIILGILTLISLIIFYGYQVNSG
jgi:hypothetical protein